MGRFWQAFAAQTKKAKKTRPEGLFGIWEKKFFLKILDMITKWVYNIKSCKEGKKYAFFL